MAPPTKEPRTAPQIEYEMLMDNPYVYTLDDVIYAAYGKRKGISQEDFFSKGWPCFRSSALCKRYGWGLHCNEEGKIAIYAVESGNYERLSHDNGIKHIKAMRSGKK